MCVRIPPGAAQKRRESEPSQLVVVCCLALFSVSRLYNHVIFAIFGLI